MTTSLPRPVRGTEWVFGGVTAVTRPARSARSRSDWTRTWLLSRRFIDLGAVTVALVAATLADRFLTIDSPQPLLVQTLVAAVFGATWFLALRVGPVSEARLVHAGRAGYRIALAATLGAFGLLGIVGQFVLIPGARALLLIALPLGAALLLTGRMLWSSHLAAARVAGRNLPGAVIIGSGPEIDFVIQQLGRTPSPSYSIDGIVRVGAVPSQAERPESSIAAFHGADTIADAVSITRADSVIVAGGSGDPQFMRSLAWSLEPGSTQLVIAAGLDSVASGRVHFDTSDGLPLMRVAPPTFTGGKHHLKRALDILVSGIALLVLLPVMAVLAILVRCDSHGPALFRQPRVGLNGRTFTMLKFRSMVVTAEADLAALAEQNEGSGVLFKLKRDPRVTRVGAILRKFSLDELPQFWNILVGDMSLVGPRPPLDSEVEAYDAHVHRRLYIKPGLTGAWQVGGRSDLSWDESVRLDLLYVENWSVLGDLRIMLKTVKVVVGQLGAY